jgi:ATP-dependent helicase/nuclease subunit B
MIHYEVNVVESNNLCSAVAEVLARSVRCGLDTVFVIVPDRFTLQAERIILAQKSCVLNLRVITFSTLFHILHEELMGDDDARVIDKTSAVLFMWRAIAQVKNDLVWFGRSAGHYAFAEACFNTVNQLSSSMVDFKNLGKSAKTEITKKKLHDICLIRDAYKELIADYTDSSGQLGWLIENICKSEIVKGARFFVAGFSHFSIQRNAVLTELAAHAGDFTLGTQEGSEFGAFIAELALNKNIDCSHQSIKSDVAKIQPQVFAFDTVQDEAVWVANEICRLVRINGVRFRDIIVVCADYENSAPVFANVFEREGIAANLDIGADLLVSPVTQYLKEYLLLAATGAQVHFINIFKNVCCGLPKECEFELEHRVLKSGARGDENVSVFTKQLQKCKTVADFVRVSKKIVDDAVSIDGGEVARRKLDELLDTMNNIMGGRGLDISEFVNVLCTLAVATKVSNIPESTDAVLLVAANEYQPSFMPYVFVTGANDGSFPVMQDDTDIITGQDIADVFKTSGLRIEPSATLANTRNRLHARHIMSSATKKLFISFCGSSPSELIEDIPVADMDDVIASRTFATHMVLKAIGDGTAFESPAYYRGVLESLDIGDMQYFNPNAKMAALRDAQRLFFPKNKARVTQIDNFRKCPFYHFLQHGLQLRQRERNTIAANVMGTLIHKLAEIFTQKIIALGSAEKLENFDAGCEMKKTVELVLGMDEFKTLAADIKNAPVISNLKKEARVLAVQLVEQIKQSAYFPRYAEKSLIGKIDGVTVSGMADRVDVDENNHAVIIDYKTGFVDTQSLQLPLYMGMLDEPYVADQAVYYSLRPGSLRIRNPSSTVSSRRELSSDNSLAIKKPSGNIDAQAVGAEIISRIKSGVIQPDPVNEKACTHCVARFMCGGCQDEED